MAEILKTAGLIKMYGETAALASLDLTLEAGRIVGLVGGNGAGKSTLLRIVANAIQPTRGAALIKGVPAGPKTHGQVSYMPDAPCLPRSMRLGSIVNWYGDLHADFDRDKARALLEELGLDTKKRFGALSRGYAERAMLALCISRRVPLYLLDEPFSAADPAAKRLIAVILRRELPEDATMVISTHLLRDVETLFDEVVFLREGRLVKHAAADDIRAETGLSIDEYYSEVMGL